MKPQIVIGTILLFFPFFFVACHHTTQSKIEPAATVTGKATLRGASVSGAVITARFAAPGPEPAITVRTSGDGQYRIANLRPGRYVFSAQSPGLALQEQTPGAYRREINLASGELQENIDFAFVRGAAVTGRVTDEKGRPVVDEMISVAASSDNSQRYVALSEAFSTDDRGVYRIYGLPPGRYTVSAGSGGGSRYQKLDYGQRYYAHTYHPNVREESKAKVIEVAEGGEISGVDIMVGPQLRTYEASGIIVNAKTGQPQPGVKWGYDGGAMSTFGPLSDENRRFRITGLLPGRYSVFAGCEGDFYSGKVEFEISDHNIDSLEIRRNPGGGVRGKVIIEGTNDPDKLRQATIYARNNASSANHRVEPDGSFYFCGLQPGKIKIDASSWPTPGFWLSRVERNGKEIKDGIDLSAGDHLTDIRVVLAYMTGRIRGQVKFENYTLPMATRLQLYASRVGETEDSRNFFAETDEQGRFLFEGLAPGEYKLGPGVYVSSGPHGRLPGFDHTEQRVAVANGAESSVDFLLRPFTR